MSVGVADGALLPPAPPGPLEAPSGPPGSALGQLWSILRPWRRLFAGVAVLTLMAALLEIVPPLVLRQVVDEHLTPGRVEGLLALAALYLGATMAIQATSALAAYLTAAAAQGALHALRVRLFDHLQALPIDFYDRTPLGDVISRCTADVETLDTLFSSGVAKVVADLSRLVTVVCAMILLSPPLAAVSALVVPPLALITRVLQVRVRAAERGNREAVGVLTTHLQETLGGVEVIRAFGRERELVARFRQALREVLAAFDRATYYSAMYPPTTGVLSALAMALLLWVGTNGAFAAWDISLGTLAAFVILFDRFFRPIRALGDDWQTVQSALSGAERIFQVLALPIDAPERVGRQAPPVSVNVTVNGTASAGAAVDQPAPSLELRRVTFGYLPERPVLRGVTLAVRSGEHIALVGRTGAGKSSALHLLSGLYEPWEGVVRVAGRDPRAIRLDERRHLVGVVPQVVQLFSGTVIDNLTLYDSAVRREAVERAVAIVGADEIIRTLPLGYDTPLSGSGRGDGVQLSAGQRQLLALARALVWDPAVLLLDEATAAIDSASDAQFRAAMRAGIAERGYAVLTVAHRLSTAREADRVLVMEGGRIVEEGPPRDLERRGGRFAALVELEAAGWNWQDGPAAGTTHHAGLSGQT